MRITTFKYTDFVGKKTERGASRSATQGGCGTRGCSCSPGHWLSLSLGIIDGVLKGMTINFDNKAEMDEFLMAYENDTYDESKLVSLGVTDEFLELLKLV